MRFIPVAEIPHTPAANAAPSGAIGSDMKEEVLPFRVKLVSNPEDLLSAVSIRHTAYMRHVPQFAQTLRAPEKIDMEEGVAILLAESKADGSPLGTLRIQTNEYRRLSVEESLELPPALAGQYLAEATRLGVTNEKVGRMVKTVLFKSFFLYCHGMGLDAMIATGRPPLDRQYDRLLFKDIFPARGYVPLSHVGDIPHRVMMLAVDDVEPLWGANDHPLFDFFFKTVHPDIDLSPAFGKARRMQGRSEKEASCAALG